jgi:hypothetical protein
MIDRQKVIKALELCRDGRCDIRCPYNNINFGCRKHLDTDAIDLLKEQPEIVRCKDCEYYKDGFCYNPNTFDDEKTRGNTVPDWYCADGEKAVKKNDV